MGRRWLALLFAFVISGCGGGGGGGANNNSSPAAVTAISGSVLPPPSPGAALPVTSVSPTPPTNMLLPPNALPSTFPAIAQTLNYTFDPTEQTLLKVSVLDFFYPLDTSASVLPFIDPTPFPGDTTLGQPNGINVSTTLSIGISGLATTDSIGGLPAFLMESILPGGGGSEVVEYAQPYSATANANGFTYQTFGSWVALPTNLPVLEGYFSAGVPSDAAILPAGGSATYTGVVSASSVDALTRDPFDVVATVNVTVNFAARTVTFNTTGTTALSNNAPSGAPYVVRPGLDLQGVLTYVVGSNTYTGVVTSADGMSGNVTGRLYGAGIGAATPSKVIGSPPEIGGTFALKASGVGAMQGAFGAK